MKILSFVLAGFLILSFSSCENKQWLQSEKKLKKEIQGSWQRIYASPSIENRYEHWIFNDGAIYITKRNTDGSIDTTDHGKYRIDATMFEPFLITSDLEQHVPNVSMEKLNGKWTIVELEDGILYIAHQPENSGVIQREFIKK
ncbi:MAG TPA: hypothetical protein PKH65_04145 [Bacteroidia bacterium]|nr:hypothetical protein [Bacteroidia bacterium]HNT79850.1 hypothetical protein [Bacteroidia bacterium]